MNGGCWDLLEQWIIFLIPNYFREGLLFFLLFFFFTLPCCRHQNTFSEADFQTRRCFFSRVVGSADTDPGAPSL